MYTNMEYGDYPSTPRKPERYRHASAGVYIALVLFAIVFVVLMGGLL